MLLKKLRKNLIYTKTTKAGRKSSVKLLRNVFKYIMEKLFPDIPLEREVSLPKACIASGGEADFAVFSDDFLESFNKRVVERKLIAVIEAKEAAEYITCDGKRIKLPHPGLLRTDTVKKAICNAYQGLIQTHSFSKSQTCRRKC